MIRIVGASHGAAHDHGDNMGDVLVATRALRLRVAELMTAAVEAEDIGDDASLAHAALAAAELMRLVPSMADEADRAKAIGLRALRRLAGLDTDEGVHVCDVCGDEPARFVVTDRQAPRRDADGKRANDGMWLCQVCQAEFDDERAALAEYRRDEPPQWQDMCEHGRAICHICGHSAW